MYTQEQEGRNRPKGLSFFSWFTKKDREQCILEYTKIKKEVTSEKYFYWEPSRYWKIWHVNFFLDLSIVELHFWEILARIIRTFQYQHYHACVQFFFFFSMRETNLNLYKGSSNGGISLSILLYFEPYLFSLNSCAMFTVQGWVLEE